MATVAQIKTAIKALLDATGAFGSVYTEDRVRIDKPNPASVVMWHDGGRQTPAAGRTVERTTTLILGLSVPQPPVNGEVELQTTMDTKLAALLDTLQAHPDLDTGAGPLVISAMADEWDIGYDNDNKRMTAEITVSVRYEVG